MKRKDIRSGDLFTGMPKLEDRVVNPEDIEEDGPIKIEDDDFAQQMDLPPGAKPVRHKSRNEEREDSARAEQARKDFHKKFDKHSEDDQGELL